MEGSLLEVRGVTKSYGAHRALDGVSLDVGAGEICGLLGPNGAGKSTLVSIVSGLRDADEGRVSIDGVDVGRGGAAVRADVGLAGQETAVYPTLTVRENLLLFADLAGLRGARRAERLDELADALEIDGFMDRLARNLSGGERRRLHAAMALVHDPKVVLLDEPTTGVDVSSRQRLLDAVRRFARRGAAVVYSTHYLPEIEQLDADVVLIDHGRVLARGPVSELVDRHGGGSVEITMTVEPPPLDGAEVVRSNDSWCITVRGAAPGRLLSVALTSLGAHVEHVTAVDVLQPSLESVFVELTGRRYRPSEAGSTEDPGDSTQVSSAAAEEPG